jgi:hypothetical protein
MLRTCEVRLLAIELTLSVRSFVFVYQCEMPVNSASRKNSLDKSCGFVYCKVDESIRPTRAEQPV